MESRPIRIEIVNISNVEPSKASSNIIDFRDIGFFTSFRMTTFATASKSKNKTN